MNDFQPLLDQARSLGEAISHHPRVTTYLAAQRAAKNDPTAQQLFRNYQDQIARIRTLEEQRKPVEVADKHTLADLESQVASNECLKALMKAQVDYVELMSRIQQAMDNPLAERSAAEPKS